MFQARPDSAIAVEPLCHWLTSLLDLKYSLGQHFTILNILLMVAHSIMTLS